MSYIKADYGRIEEAAKIIEDYVIDIRKKMNQASVEITTLSLEWNGRDFNYFKLQWDKTIGSSSAFSEMINSLEVYSKFLEAASSKYREAQINAINRADNMLRW